MFLSHADVSLPQTNKPILGGGLRLEKRGDDVELPLKTNRYGNDWVHEQGLPGKVGGPADIQPATALGPGGGGRMQGWPDVRGGQRSHSRRGVT